MISLQNEIDFTKQKTQSPEYEPFYKQAIKQIQKQDSEILAKFKKPIFDQDMENHLIVTNIPNVTGKQEKFLGLFNNFLEKKKIGKSNGLESCQLGYKNEGDKKICNQTMYVIYKTAQNAKKAYQKLHMLKFDPTHTLSCFTVKQFRLVQKLPQNYTEPKHFTAKQMRQYNLDQFHRDQFLYRLSGSDSEKVYLKWFDHVEKTALDAINDESTNNTVDLKQRVKNIVCSPRGSYVAVCVSEGIRIHSGPKLETITILPHKGACDVKFSPQENYMISYTGVNNQSKSYESIMLWSVAEQVCLHSIRAGSFHDLSSIQFDKNDNRLAIIGEHQVFIHNCSSFVELKKSLQKSEDQLIESGNFLKALNVKKVQWMPDNANLLVISYEINPASNSHPTSKIYFYNADTKEQRKWRAIGQHIKKVQITVSDDNDWVAVSFKKEQKKTHHSSIFIVNLTKRQIETEFVEIKESVVSIAWDKKVGRFGVVHAINTGIKSAHTQFKVLFYQIQKQNGIQTAVKICEIEKTPLNRLIMAQNGVYFALYNTSPESSGRDKYSIAYFGKDHKNKKTNIEFVKQDCEVSYMSFFFIDPSGRFVVLGTDKMFQIWTLAGQLVYKNNETLDIKNVQFRPRYLVETTSAEEKSIAQKEKEIKKKYGELDQQRTNALEYQRQKEKQQQRQKFKAFVAEKKKWYNQYKAKIAEIRGFADDDPKVKSQQYSYFQIERN